jgi:hypothetical protein
LIFFVGRSILFFQRRLWGNGARWIGALSSGLLQSGDIYETVILYLEIGLNCILVALFQNDAPVRSKFSV